MNHHFQVSSLSQDLAQAHHQLSASTANVSRLEGELGEAWTKLQRGQESWREREAKLTQSLQQSEVIRQSLLHQVCVCGSYRVSTSERSLGITRVSTSERSLGITRVSTSERSLGITRVSTSERSLGITRVSTSERSLGITRVSTSERSLGITRVSTSERSLGITRVSTSERSLGITWFSVLVRNYTQMVTSITKGAVLSIALGVYCMLLIASVS